MAVQCNDLVQTTLDHSSCHYLCLHVNQKTGGCSLVPQAVLILMEWCKAEGFVCEDWGYSQHMESLHICSWHNCKWCILFNRMETNSCQKLYSFHPCGSVMLLLPFLTVQGFKLYSNTGHWRAIIHQLYSSAEEVWCTPMIEVTSQQLVSEKEEPETKDPELWSLYI